MLQKWEVIVTELLKVKPIKINSTLVSAQNRKRLYWTNIPIISKLKDKNLKIKDIIYDNTYKVFTNKKIQNSIKYTKYGLKFKNSGRDQQDRAYLLSNKAPCLLKSKVVLKFCLDWQKGICRELHPIEAERLQTVPDNYTKLKDITDIKRKEVLGDGWTVDIIVFLLQGIKVKEE